MRPRFCRDCAQERDRYDSEQMRACAEACGRAAEKCRALAA